MIDKSIARYSIDTMKLTFHFSKKKWHLMDNLNKYMIKWVWKKEKLSSNIDKNLYGK